MHYDKELIAHKLRRWEAYFLKYQLPEWPEIPNVGLYMDQVISLLDQYLDYLPPEIKEDQLVTPTAINNYVRTKTMPEPQKKRYYRIHIAYLVMICTLKQSISIAMIKRIIPFGVSEREAEAIYSTFIKQHRASAKSFISGAKSVAAPILGLDGVADSSVNSTEELIVTTAVIGGFARLVTEKLLLLDGRKMDDFADEVKEKKDT